LTVSGSAAAAAAANVNQKRNNAHPAFLPPILTENKATAAHLAAVAYSGYRF
jgi:hypothetical protein